MENHGTPAPVKEDSPEGLPSLIKVISLNGVSGFDSVEGYSDQPIGHPVHVSSVPMFAFPSGSTNDKLNEPFCWRFTIFRWLQETVSASNAQLVHAVSISMPSSPTGSKTVLFANLDEAAGGDGSPDSTPPVRPKENMFHSQPMPRVTGENLPGHHRVQELKDKRFDTFKTWSGRLERQLSNLRGKPRPPSPEDSSTVHNPGINLPVERYFAALEGPELDNLRVCLVSSFLYTSLNNS